ncbi:DUF192 domain-containing protein [Planctomycetota bacterium]
MRKRWHPACALAVTCVAFFFVTSACNSSKPEKPGANTLNIEGKLLVNSKEICVAIADTPDERSKGLMFVPNLPVDQGMLFIYSKAQELSFWMKNTYIPLDIAYIDEHGKIINILHMEPLSEFTRGSGAPVMYALEMNQGWFEENGVKIGDRVGNLPQISQESTHDK